MDVIVQEFMDKIRPIPDKNHGGCLLMAYTFYKWLQKHNLPTNDFHIVEYGWWGDSNIRENLEWIDSPEDNSPCSDSHFTWEYKGKEYDGEGEYRNSKPSANREVLYGLNKYDLTDHFCMRALNEACWNDTFDRSFALDFIQEQLDIEFPEVHRFVD